MSNKQKGNMYPWVTHTKNFIKGKCPHACIYCYMLVYPLKEVRFDLKELKEDLGSGNTFFIGSSCDMFAEEIPPWWIDKIFEYLEKYQDNTYLFQSKNPKRFLDFYNYFPVKTILGTTLETNRDYESRISKAPPVSARVNWMEQINNIGKKDVMVSAEPIMEFDIDEFIGMIKRINPKFVSIGADSKGFLKKFNIPEPSMDKVNIFIDKLKNFTEVKVKSNIKYLNRSDKVYCERCGAELTSDTHVCYDLH